MLCYNQDFKTREGGKKASSVSKMYYRHSTDLIIDVIGHVVLVDTTSFDEKGNFPFHEFQKRKTQNTTMFFL